MPAPLHIVMRLPKLKHLTEGEATRRLGITLAELEEANSFALVCFADPDPDFRLEFLRTPSASSARSHTKTNGRATAKGGTRLSQALTRGVS